jgi:hypothetical protein
MDDHETSLRQLADDIDDMTKRARQLRLETVVYVLETAKIEVLRATRPQAPNTRSIRGFGVSRVL